MGEGESSGNGGELGKAAIVYTIRTIIGVTIMGSIFFLSAGRIDIPKGWLALGIFLGYSLLQIVIFYKWNPDILITRLKRRIGPYNWDKAFIIFLGIMMYGMYVVFGLDIGRFQWSSLGLPFFISGLILFGISSALMTWTMVVNRFFENIVRIQTDRNHQVISNGPYKYIRHPGYLFGFLNFLAIPLILGSAYGLIPFVFLGILMAFRTSLEDKVLRQELAGYAEYAKKTKYKIIPYIW